MSLLDVSGLCLTAGGKTLVNNISFSVAAGETLAIVGESGSECAEPAAARHQPHRRADHAR
jgi:ABC-type phosphonate transport system ATPase subunit